MGKAQDFANDCEFRFGPNWKADIGLRNKYEQLLALDKAEGTEAKKEQKVIEESLQNIYYAKDLKIQILEKALREITDIETEDEFFKELRDFLAEATENPKCNSIGLVLVRDGKGKWFVVGSGRTIQCGIDKKKGIKQTLQFTLKIDTRKKFPYRLDFDVIRGPS